MCHFGENTASTVCKAADVLVAMVVVEIVNDKVFVNVTCGEATVTGVVVAPTICVVRTLPAETADDVDAVTGRDVMICWMCVPPAIL